MNGRYLLPFILIFLLPGLASAQCVSTQTGPWNDASTWATCDGVPDAASDVLIDASHQVSLVEEGEANSVEISADAVLDGSLLNLSGDLVVDGILDNLSVQMVGSGDRVITGEGDVLFDQLSLSMDDVADVFVDALIITSNGGVLLQRGKLYINSASQFTPFTYSNTIEEDAGLVVNHQNAELSHTHAGGLDVDGDLAIHAGYMEAVSSASSTLEIRGTGTLQITGGVLETQGRYRQGQGSSAVIEGGELRVASGGATGTGSSSTFDIVTGATYAQSGGLVHIYNGTSHDTHPSLYLRGAESNISFDGGSLQLGYGVETEGLFSVRSESGPFGNILMDLGDQQFEIRESAFRFSGDWEVASGVVDTNELPVIATGGALQQIESPQPLEIDDLVIENGTQLRVASDLHLGSISMETPADDLIIASDAYTLTTEDPTQTDADRERTITGDAGWRMLSAPGTGLTVQDLADQGHVQGVKGSYSWHDPNVYLSYNGESWLPAISTSDQLEPGSGFLWYFFGSEVDETVTALGAEEPDDPVVALNSQNEYTLIGNPYGHAIRVRDLVGHTAQIPRTVQVWRDEPGAPNAGTDGSDTGSFVVLSDDDEIPVWDGMLIENTVTNEQGEAASAVTIPQFARIDQEAQQQMASMIAASTDRRRVQLSLTTYSDEGVLETRDEAASVYFRDGASLEWDLWDASKITPPEQQYATVSLVGERDASLAAKAQDSRPYDPDQTFEIPLAIEASNTSGSFMLSWPRLENIPDSGWSIQLIDRIEGTTADLLTADSYSFEWDGDISEELDHTRFTLAFSGEALPVELAAVEIVQDNGQGVLSWSTISETNNSHFLIEHRAPGSEAFTRLSEVEGAGTSIEQQYYTYRTPHLAAGTHTFVLEQVDTDGTTTRTDELTLTIGIDGHAKLYAPTPNPVTDQSLVQFVTAQAQPVTLALHDALGRHVDTLFDGSTSAHQPTEAILSATGLSSGVYFLRLTGEDLHEIRQVVVVR